MIYIYIYIYIYTNQCVTRDCVSVLSVDGDWGPWKAWSRCTVICGQGIRERTRQCDSVTPIYGGKACEGLNSMTRECNRMRCPGNFLFLLLYNINKVLIYVIIQRSIMFSHSGYAFVCAYFA